MFWLCKVLAKCQLKETVEDKEVGLDSLGNTCQHKHTCRVAVAYFRND